MKFTKRPQKKWTTMDFYLRGRACYLSRYRKADWQPNAKKRPYSYSLWSNNGELLYDTEDMTLAVEAFALYEEYKVDGVSRGNNTYTKLSDEKGE